MKITSRASDYALLLLIHLASLPAEETTNVKKVAEKLKISLRFLANIANKLAIARIIVSHRGTGGGIRLGRPSHTVSIREVIEAVDGPIQTMFCQNSPEVCSHEVGCQMKYFWDEIQGTVMARLNQASIQDFAASPPYGSVSHATHDTAPYRAQVLPANH